MTLTTYRNNFPTLWDNLFEDFFETREHASLSPRARITEKADGIYVALELPGVKKEDVKVSVENGVLSIHAIKKAEKEEKAKDVYLNEISFGEYKRSFRLSDHVKHEGIEAAFENGVLTLKLAKREEAKAKRIEIR